MVKRTLLFFYATLSLAVNTPAYAAYEEKLAIAAQDSQVPSVDILEGAGHLEERGPVVGNNLPDSTADTLRHQGTSAVSGVQQIGKGIGTRVNSKGNMPLRHAVYLLLPRGWNADVADDIAQTPVAWGKHENWVSLLGKICSEINAEAIVNWEVRNVSIRSSSSVPAPSLPKNAGASSGVAMVKMSAKLDARPVAVPVVRGSLTTGSLPPYTVRASATAAQIAKRNRIPLASFCRWNEVRPEQNLPTGYRVHLQQPAQTSAKSTSVPVSTAPLSTTPILLKSSTQESLSTPIQHTTQPDTKEEVPQASLPESTSAWSITSGNLQAQVSAWAARANYQLIWKTQNDFEMESNASFQGDFLDAIRQLFMGLQRSGHALRVTLYQGNNVLEVSEE